jgi:hypothetical protein
MDGPAFATYVRDVLAPELAPGSVVILDKLATQRNVEAAAAIAPLSIGSCICRPIRPTCIPSSKHSRS